MSWHIVDLPHDTPDVIEQTAALLHDAFRGRTEDWQDLESAREEVMASLAPDRISRVAIDDDAGRSSGRSAASAPTAAASGSCIRSS